MTPKTRLDPFVRMRERHEESALDALASAQRSLGAASERLRSARAQASADERGSGDSSMWAAEEAAHARVVHEVRGAEREVQKAAGGEHAARAAYERAWREAEASRRLREKARRAIVHEAERREQHAVDELATLVFNHVNH
jgi:flagellar export protein FliJ